MCISVKHMTNKVDKYAPEGLLCKRFSPRFIVDAEGRNMKTEEYLKHMVDETDKRAKQLASAIDDTATFLAAGIILFLFDEVERTLVYLACAYHTLRRVYALRHVQGEEPKYPTKREEDLRDIWLQDMKRHEIAHLRRENRRILKEAGSKTEEYCKNKNVIKRLKEGA